MPKVYAILCYVSFFIDIGNCRIQLIFQAFWNFYSILRYNQRLMIAYIDIITSLYTIYATITRINAVKTLRSSEIAFIALIILRFISYERKSEIFPPFWWPEVRACVARTAILNFDISHVKTSFSLLCIKNNSLGNVKI